MDQQKEEAFLKQLNQHAGILHRICNSYCVKTQDRQDLFQEMIFQLWKSYPSFAEKSAFSTWMYRVALNTALAQSKRQSRLTDEAPLDERSIALVAASDAEQASPKIESLYLAIAELPPADRAIILMHLDEFSYDDIAQVMGISKNHVSVKLVRIKKRLENKLRSIHF